MSGKRYDYIVVGRWRNRDGILPILDKLKSTGKKVYCFLDNEYDGDGIKFETNPDADPETMMAATESLSDWQTNPTFRKIFEADMDGLRQAEALIMVFPSGLAAHMELGAAYGMGKKCFGIGAPDKPETLYLMFDKIYPDVGAFMEGQL
ncbi:MAG TPA: hypothetical protein VMR45_01385 [Patescibacteria group bacterium]|nr:hypothetical protein [Patescibacteria group bacterium]